MQTENSSIAIDRRSLLKGLGIAAAGLVTMEAARMTGIGINAQALKAHTDGQMQFSVVRKPGFKGKNSK